MLRESPLFARFLCGIENTNIAREDRELREIAHSDERYSLLSCRNERDNEEMEKPLRKKPFHSSKSSFHSYTRFPPSPRIQDTSPLSTSINDILFDPLLPVP